ncbi:MAG: peptidase A24 [Proteobacteria bacterium SG_bin7]|nr:MAG: peptidase A24 [Proteobacteria bacterium SG_bin7]
MGSFGNVIILRLPKGESVVRPRSYCYSCKELIRWYDNIPILSWFILRGKCRSCQASYSFRYPLVEFLTALLFCLVYMRFSEGKIINLRVFEYIFFVWALVVVSMIDFDHMILPDVFTLSGIVVGLVFSIFSPDRSFWEAFGGVLFGGGIFWLISYMYYIWRGEDGIGGGDIKLSAWIGAVLGWKAIPFVVLSSSILGSVVGLILVFKTKAGWKLKIPYGPYLALGAVLYLFCEEFGMSFLNIFFPSLGPE